MNKSFLHGMGASVMAIVLSLPVFLYSTAHAAEYNWKFAHEEPADGFMDLVAREFSKKLAEKSNGKIALTIYPSGTLGNVEDLVELTQNNVIQFNIASAGTLSTQIPQIQVLLLHYLFPKDMNVVRSVLEQGEFRNLLAPLFKAKKLEALTCVVEGWQVWTSSKPLSSPADFKNFKMRTMPSDLLVAAYKAYGANPTPVEFSQVYSALQLKMIDGQENPVYAIEDMKFYEVQDYLTFGYTGLMFLTLIANADALAALPPDLRGAVDQAVTETVAFAFACENRLNTQYMDKMLRQKPTLNRVDLDDAQIDAFRKLAVPLYDMYTKDQGGKGAGEILETLRKDIAKASTAK